MLTSETAAAAAETMPTSAEMLAKLPPLPKISRPFFRDLDQIGTVQKPADQQLIADLISGHGLDDLVEEIFHRLPDIAAAVTKVLGPKGLVVQARPSNTINALTIPTADGAVVIYNLGLYSLVYSLGVVVGLTAIPGIAPGGVDRERLVDWLSLLVDWATSPAREPRIEPLALTDEQQNLAGSVAGQAQRFGLCHELGHVLSPTTAGLAPRRSVVQGVGMSGRPASWGDEFAADAAGFDMMIRLNQSKGSSPVGALIGAELFLNGLAMLEQRADVPSQNTHPPADERLGRLRQQFLTTFGEQSFEIYQPGMVVGEIVAGLRPAVAQRAASRRAAVTAELAATFDVYAVAAPTMSDADKLAASTSVSRYLLQSPGATLEFLRSELAAPQPDSEPASGSDRRLLAWNAVHHFEPALRRAIGLPVA